MASSSPPLIVSSATPDDLLPLAALHRRAFSPSPIYAALWSQTTQAGFENWHYTRSQEWSKKPGHHIVVAKKGGDLVGHAWWERNEMRGEGVVVGNEGSTDGKPTVGGQMDFPEGADVELCREFYSRVDDYDKTITEPHWHLQILGADPAAQRTGAGRALVEWGVARAHAEGLPAYVASQLTAIPFYEKVGFRSCGAAVSSADGSAACYPMIFPPPARE